MLIKIKYDSDKGWALLDEREFVEGVHERYVEPQKSDKLVDTLSGTVKRTRKPRKE